MAADDIRNLFYSFNELRTLGYTNDRVTLMRRIKRGEFPRPIRIGGSLRWLKADLEKWLNDRIAERTK